MKSKIKKQSLFFSTAMLLFSNIFVKGLGFFYRVMLVRLLGTEGVGLMEMVSPLFSFLLVLAGCGIQPALSQIVAGRGQEKQAIYFHTAKRLLLISGLVVTAIAFLLAPWLISNFVTDARTELCFLALIPAVLVISLASAWRGVIQGRRQVATLGMSQNSEQIVRVLLGIWLTMRLLNMGLETAVTATSIATVCGEIIGFAYLIIKFRHDQKKETAAFFDVKPNRAEFRSAARELFSFGLPTTAGKLVATFIALAQAFLIPYCLQQAGWDARAATEIYGRFTGVALTLLHLPNVFTTALSVSVLPAVAESMNMEQSGRKLLRRRISGSMQAVVTFTLPCMAIMFVLADFLCARLFNNPLAAVLVRWLVVGGIFCYMQVTMASVLQGLGEVKKLLVNNTASGTVMLLGIALLTTRPELGILGTAIAMIISWMTGFLLNYLSIRSSTGIVLPWGKILLRPLAGVAAALAGYVLLITSAPQNWADAIIATALIGGIYFVIIALLGGADFFKLRKDKAENKPKQVRFVQDEKID